MLRTVKGLEEEVAGREACSHHKFAPLMARGTYMVIHWALLNNMQQLIGTAARV